MTDSSNPSLPLPVPRGRPRPRPAQAGPRAASPGGDTHAIPGHYAKLFLAGMIALVLYFDIKNPNNTAEANRVLATLVFLVSCLPMYLFLSRGKSYQVPALESHAMFYAMSFGFAGFLPLSAANNATTVNELLMFTALVNTFFGMLALYAGYYFLGPKVLGKVKPMHPGEGIAWGTLEMLAWGAVVVGYAAEYIANHTGFTLMIQLTKLVSDLGFYLLLILALEKRMSMGSRALVYLVLLPCQVLLNCGLSGGQLAGIVCLVCYVSLVLLRCWRRVPIALLAGAFIFFIVFQPVKFYVREMAWNEGVKLSPLEMIQAYGRGFLETYGSSHSFLASGKDNFETSFDRINHLALLAAVIRDTPSRQPFLHGKTYLPLLTKPIPRFLWPGKPEEKLGNRWAVSYGYLGENDSTTSFNLPWLVEMYMNGGTLGVIIVMLLLGIMYRYLWLAMMSSSTNPADYAVAMVFAQSMIFAESNLSMQIGSVMIFAIILWVLVKFMTFFQVYAQPVRRSSLPRSRALPARV